MESDGPMMTRQHVDQLAQRYQAYVASDSYFQRQARVMQSLWRDEQGYPIGLHREISLGSRLAMPWAEETLGNYLTETIRDVVRREVFSPKRSQEKLFGYPRIINDLLSSQPLCFNLFGELQQDLSLASQVFADLTKGHIRQVIRIEFEYSPGRGSLDYTGDASAFDVYAEYLTDAGAAGFLGIEVKYHENLQNPAARHRSRYDEVATLMGCFSEDAHEALCRKPLHQIWRDHLLVGSLLHQEPRFAEGRFVFLYPQANIHCAQAVTAYERCLSERETFLPWTLETVHAALKRNTSAAWVQEFYLRYLGFAKLARYIASA